MSSLTVEPESESFPTIIVDPVTRMDALFGVFRYARLLSSPTTTTDADTNTAVMTDRRIVRVTGPLVHSDILSKVLWFAGDSIEGVHVKTIPIVSEQCQGVTVNASETLMVVSCDISGGEGNKLYVYALPGGELLKTIGGWATGSVQFAWPRRVCFGPDDVIIVADRGNSRLQELTATGEYKRSIGLTHPFALCLSNNKCMIGVGTGYPSNAVVLLDYVDFTEVRTISGQFKKGVAGVEFTPDDKHVLATDFDMAAVLMFAVADGLFVRSVCEGLGQGPKDLCFAGNGDVIIADYGSHRVCVFSSDGSTLKRQIGREGTDVGQFKNPTALSCVNGRLYVLDFWSSRVQVFE